MQERFVKVNGKTIFESELKLMSLKQLQNLIDECKEAVSEIERKSEDYQNHIYENMDKAHFNEVVSKFRTAAIYLQSDIVMISKIIRERDEIDEDELKLKWLTEYYRVINGSISKWKMNKAIKLVDERCGFSAANLLS